MGSSQWQERLFLIGRIGGQQYALPAEPVESILRMMEFTPVADGTPNVPGVVSVYGVVLPLVDPRPRLGLPTPPGHPDQHLVVVDTGSRFVLWVDRIERDITAGPDSLSTPQGVTAGSLTPQVLQLGDEVVPVLCLEALARF